MPGTMNQQLADQIGTVLEQAANIPRPDPRDVELEEKVRAEIARNWNHVLNPTATLRLLPKLMVQPKLTDDGKIKPRQRYKTGLMVRITNQVSNWGTTEVGADFVGIITDVLEDHLKVRAIGGNANGGARVRLAYGNSSDRNAGKIITVTKASASIVNPYAYGAVWWAIVNVLDAMARKRKRDELRARLGMQQLSDHRRHFRKWQGKRATGQPHWWEKGTRYGYAVRDLYSAAMRRDVAALNSVKLDGLDDDVIAKVNDLMYRREEGGVFITRARCRHLVIDGDPNTRAIVYDDQRRSHYYCPDCAAKLVADTRFWRTVLDADNRPIIAHVNNRFYDWEDGTVRVNPQPPLIGQYHSSKKRIGLLAKPFAAPYAKDELTVGYELEMESAKSGEEYLDEDTRNELARGVYRRMMAAAKVGEMGGKQQYAFFERDGSVDSGFEMVTAYGSMDTHRFMVPRIFGPVEGESPDDMPFVGKLRSHDANASCGLHVHMAKPLSLMHAAKLQAFFHDPENKRIIRSVARRYAVNYAKVVTNKAKEHTKANLKQALNYAGYEPRYARTDKGHKVRNYIKDAITNLSNGDRYQQVNYCNPATVEIRVFKGSMLPTTIMACLEFSTAVWHFSRDARADQLTTPEFLKWVCAPRNRKETAFLRAYLATRGYDVYLPKPKKNASPVLTEITAEDA